MEKDHSGGKKIDSEATPSCPVGDGETDKVPVCFKLTARKYHTDAGCSMLDAGYKNELNPYFIQYPVSRIYAKQTKIIDNKSC